MTDVLIRDPNESGEIPLYREPGQTTTNLTWVTQAPAFRRPDATFKVEIIEGGCRTVVPNDEDFESPDELQGPQPKPRPLPKPTPKADRPPSDGGEIIWTAAPETPYVGRHRRPSRWDWLSVPLSMAVQRLSAAWSEK